MLLFSHKIGVQSFLETFNQLSSENSFGKFLDSLVNSIGLLRGVHVVSSPWWRHLQTTEIGRILADTHFDHTETPGTETTDLTAFIEKAEIIEEHRSTYKETIVRLQRHFDQLHHVTEDYLATPRYIIPLLRIFILYLFKYAVMKADMPQSRTARCFIGS